MKLRFYGADRCGIAFCDRRNARLDDMDLMRCVYIHVGQNSSSDSQ